MTFIGTLTAAFSRLLNQPGSGCYLNDGEARSMAAAQRHLEGIDLDKVFDRRSWERAARALEASGREWNDPDSLREQMREYNKLLLEEEVSRSVSTATSAQLRADDGDARP